MSTKLLLLCTLASLAIVACRVGGASEYQQPSLDVQWPLPEPDTGTAIEETSEPAETEPAETEAQDSTVADTIAEIGADVSSAESLGETIVSETSVETAPPVDAGCVPGTPAVCDPVKNTGCASLSRCTTSSTANTGRCVYLGAIGVGGFCTATDSIPGFLGTDTCSPKLACVSSKCVALCYCNGDCESGSCCSVTIGTTGFKGCGACP